MGGFWWSRSIETLCDDAMQVFHGDTHVDAAKITIVGAGTLGLEYAHVRQQTKGILFLGTPHRGSSFTTLGSLVALWLGPIGADALILRELDYDSTYLRDLHTHFVRIVKHERDAFTQVFNVFEQRPTLMLRCGALQWAQLVVHESSTTYTGTQYVQNMGDAVDHSGLNKFARRFEGAGGGASRHAGQHGQSGVDVLESRAMDRGGKAAGRQIPNANICQLVYDWLCDERKGRWLLVLDDVDDAGFLFEAHSHGQDRALLMNLYTSPADGLWFG